MTPTMKLRFVDRRITISRTEFTAEFHDVRILQQWHVYSDGECYQRAAKGDLRTGEWVDVPLEEEEK